MSLIFNDSKKTEVVRSVNMPKIMFTLLGVNAID